jgi:hypothetical protein
LAVAGVLASAVVLVVLAAVASISPLRSADHELLNARDALQSATGLNLATLASSKGRSSAEAAASTANVDAAAAQDRLEGSWGLDVLRFVPWLSDQRDAAVSLAAAARTGSVAALSVLRAAGAYADGARSQRGLIPLAGMGHLAAVTYQAGTTLEGLDRTPGILVLSPLARARRELNRVAVGAGVRLVATGRTLSALDVFLGAHGPQRDLVAIENNAEMRDQGIVSSFAVVTFSAGHVILGPHGSVEGLAVPHPVDVPLPAGTQVWFGDEQPTQLWESVNSTADFPLSGQLMTAMYAEAGRPPVDGVIALDVPALADLLGVTGPLAVPGLSQPLSATNAVPLLLDQIYQRYPLGSQSVARRGELSQVVQTVFHKLDTGGYNPVSLGEALTQAIAGGHVHLYSAAPAVEAIFSSEALGGGPATALANHTFHLAVENGTATKLDYFVDPKVAMSVSLQPSGTAVVKTTVTVLNTAPRNAQPSYQFGPLKFQTRAGQYVARVYFWGPAGSKEAGGQPESGLELTEANVSVEPAASTAVVFTTVVPHAVTGGILQLRLVPQPRANPVPLTVTLSAPGWRVQGSTTISPTWDRTVMVSWAVVGGTHR